MDRMARYLERSIKHHCSNRLPLLHNPKPGEFWKMKPRVRRPAHYVGLSEFSRRAAAGTLTGRMLD